MSDSNNTSNFITNSAISSLEQLEQSHNQEILSQSNGYFLPIRSLQQNSLLVYQNDQNGVRNQYDSQSLTIDTMDKVNSINSSRRPTTQEIIEQIDKLKIKIGETTENLRNQLQQQIDILKKEYNSKIDNQKRKYNSKINNLKNDFTIELDNLKKYILAQKSQQKIIQEKSEVKFDIQSKKQLSEQVPNQSLSPSELSEIIKKEFPLIKEDQRDKYKIIKQLGEGVWLVNEVGTQKQYALKKIKRSKVFGNELSKNIINQVSILRELNSPLVIKLNKTYSEKIDNDQIQYCMLLQFAGQKNLRSFENLTFQRKRMIIQNLITGLKYIHDHNIIHRDIKPENVLVTLIHQNILSVKICDFGESTKLKEQIGYKRKSFHGTYMYMAPQILNNLQHDMKSDIWSLGVLIYELVFGKLPFNLTINSSMSECAKKINNNLIFPSESSKQMKLFQVLLKKLLVHDPEKRLSAKEVSNQLFRLNLNVKISQFDFKLWAKKIQSLPNQSKKKQ